jgi:hypothetical protein
MVTLKQAAYIVGCLGGRPSTKKCEYSSNGGGGAAYILYYTTEDLSNFYTDESGNYYEVE